MQAKQFIDQLDTLQLLSPEIVEELRRQVSESKSRLTPELIARLLVDNGHLTKFQAQKLIADIKDQNPEPQRPTPAVPELDFVPEVDPVAAVFVDEDEPFEPEKVEVIDTEPIEIVDTEPIEVVEAVDESRPTAAPVPKKKLATKSDKSTKGGKSGKSVKPATASHKSGAPKENPWDSSRILLSAFALGVLLIMLTLLARYFLKGNAEETMKRADEQYQARSYETAAKLYKDFVSNFQGDANYSLAKVRFVLATLRKDIENASDPNIGLKTAQELLPGIASESALITEQSDLTGVLLNLATKFNERADKANSIADRKALMTEMEKLQGLISNPQYVGAGELKKQEPTIARINEDRARILRDINREEQLVVAIGAIESKLKEKDTAGAYEVRRAIVREYPQLEIDERLTAKLAEATAIQKDLVAPGTVNITLGKEPPASPVTRSFVLANSSRGSAPELASRLVYVKAKGSVYGLDGQTGKVLWRRFVGRGFKSEPIRLNDTDTSDVLICEPETGRLERVVGATGVTQWLTEFSSPVHQPFADGEDVYVTAHDGNLVNLDAVTGQTKWMTKLPQAIQVSPGSGLSRPTLYVAGENSNLYAISRSDGTCQEVFYLGHRSGSIAVPPMLVLGQLFVFENRGDHSLVRILRTNDRGLGLADAQTPFRLKGNIVVPPQIDGRRLFVISDLGEIAVLDIEPSSQKDKVSRFDPVLASMAEPRLAYIIAGNSRLWIAESSFIRMDLIVTRGKLDRIWVKDDGDVFTSIPQLVGNTVVHTRILRGSAGVRVSAVNAETGDPLWATDLASPIAAITTAANRPAAVNSAAMLFVLDHSKAVQTNADVNAGAGKPQLQFQNPTVLANGATVFFNSTLPNQIALLSPAENDKLRVLLANFTGAKPSCVPTAVGDKFAVGLDNGQLVLIDPVNGAPAAKPYQPPVQPGTKFRWVQPVYIEDSKTLVAAHDANRLLRLGVGESLRMLSEVPLEQPMVGALVALGNRVFGIEASQVADKLLSFDSTNLNKLGEVELQGRLVSGPYSVDGNIYLQTEGGLHAYSAEHRKLWSIEFPNTRLLSSPLKSFDQLVVLSTSGQVWWINPADGAVIKNLDVGQPLSGMPKLVTGGSILAGTDDGMVVLIPGNNPRATE